jgi:hypothetical protein
MLQMSNNVHDVVKTRAKNLLLVPELGNKSVDIIDCAFGFNTRMGFVKNSADFLFGHDEVASNAGLL